jgi:hypothetical protein
MRTGFIGLNSYLYKISRAESPYCSCDSGYQTVSHILGDCYLYRRQRRKFFGAPIVRDVPYTLSDPHLAPSAAQFMLDTGLLDQFNTFCFRILLAEE